MHGRSSTRSKEPVVDSSAWILAGHRVFPSDFRSSGRRRDLRALQDFDVYNLEGGRADIVDPVRERAIGCEYRKVTGFGKRRGAFWIAEFLLGYGATEKFNGYTVVDMGVVKRAFPGWQGQVNDHNRVVLQHNVMKRLVFNRHRRGCRRLLRNKNLKQEEKKNKTGFCDHSCPDLVREKKRKISYTGFPEGQGI